MSEEYVTFHHSGNLGDIVYSLPTVVDICRRSHAKANLLLEVGKPGYYYASAQHPLKNVRLSEEFARQLIPLLLQQPYVVNAGLYEGGPVDVDLDDFRQLEINFASGYIARWYFYAYLASYDLSQPWLRVTPDARTAGRIVVARSRRYRNHRLSYAPLRGRNVLFLGMDDEYQNFVREVPDAEYLPAADFLELAGYVAGAGLFVGNQSFCYALAEALKPPRILEVCPFAPNVIPHGEKAWDVYTTEALEAVLTNA